MTNGLEEREEEKGLTQQMMEEEIHVKAGRGEESIFFALGLIGHGLYNDSFSQPFLDVLV